MTARFLLFCDPTCTLYVGTSQVPKKEGYKNMKQGSKIGLYVSLSLLAAFVLWTVLVSTVDVQAIGPQESRVGLATLNARAHNRTGLHMTLYTLTEWLGLILFR